MRYEDASHTGAFTQGSEPDARNDADAIAAGAQGPATGNVITGEGTQTGPSGSDYGPGAHITTIAGAGGEDSSFAGGKLAVSGEFGRLSIDAEGNYSYVAKAGTPENSRDTFTYTLADAQGNADTATLMIEIGKTPAVIKANAQQVVPGPDGVVILPPGVELSDIQVVGRNLVINLPDGSQMVIIDGAVFVPQLVLGGVEVPATNLAALLVGQEIAPAAGEGPPLSSGGNFDVPVPPLDPGIPLGDLLPPTELFYTPPEVREVFDLIDEEPEIFIQPDGQPATVAAVDSVDEKGLPERNEGEPEGSGEEAAAGADGDPSEATGGTIVVNSPDGVDSLTITGADGIPREIVVGLIVEGEFGTLTITGAVGSNFTYSYVLDDNIDHSDGVPDHDDFSVTLTDNDGDQATATLQIDIADDTPTARPDTDVVPAGEFGPVTGNVITDDSPTNGDDGDGDNGRDTVGADDADLTAVTGFGSTEATEGGFIVQGQYGVLTISSDGEYSYLRNEGTPGGVTDVFNYTLTDGDGDTSATTLTITIEDTPPTIDVPVAGEDGTLVNEKGLPERDGNLPNEPAGTGEAADGDGTDNDDGSETTSGTVNFTEGDGPATIRIDGVIVTGVGQEFAGAHGTLTITAVGPTSVSYSYTLTDNTSGDATFDDFAFSVTDSDGDVASGTLTIDIIDDTPLASPDTDIVPAGTYGPATGNVITDAEGDPDSGKDNVGADNAVVAGVAAGDTGTDLESAATVGAVVQGAFGKLTLNADGSYSYVRDPGTDGGVSDVFTYTLRDGDGDLVSTTLTITIENSPPTIDVPTEGEAGTVVDEKGLPERDGNLPDEPAGTGEAADGNGADNDDTSETTTGTVNFTPGDGPATIRIDGVIVTAVNQEFVGAHGTLTVTAIGPTSISYSYTLTDNTSGDATFDDFAFSVTDQDDDVANGTLTIDIVDDAPIANDDSNSVSEGSSVNGNVLPNDLSGADDYDGAVVGGVTGNDDGTDTTNMVGGQIVLVGTFGTLTLNDDGSYTYDADPNTNPPADAVDEFVYTIRDGDGDLDSAVLTIDVNDVNLPADNQNKVVNEAALDLNDDGSDLAAGSVTGSNPSSTAETVSGTLNVAGAVSYVIVGSSTGTHGIIQINSDGTYIYTLTDPVDGPTADNGTNTIDNVETFTYEADDGNGNTVQGTITIDVIDDVPTAAVSTAGFTLAHDETPGLQDTDVAGPLAAFAGVANTGDDPDVLPNGAGSVIGFATSTGAVSSTGTVFGADGPAADPNDVVFSLDVFADGVDSLLNVTSGESILLHEEGGLIVGRVSGGTFDGQAAFAISIDPATGQMSMVQYLSIQHTNTASNDESASIANGAILAVVTTTDGDGDVDTASTGIGNLISFQDDGPTAVAAAAITSGLENGGGDSATASLDTGDGNVFNNFGADGGKVIFTAASQAYLEGLDLKHAGVELTYVISNGGQTITGSAGATQVITIELQPGGTSNYTVTMHDSIDTLVTTVFDDLNFDFVGGNGSWAGFTSGTIGDDVDDLLLTPMVNGGHASTMNTNANEGGVGSGNSVSFGEGVRIDSVNDLQAVPSPTPSGDYSIAGNRNHVFGEHENVIGLSGLLSTVNGPPGSTVDVNLIARDEAGASDTNDQVGDGAIEAITVVTITHGAFTATVLKSGGLDQDVVVDGISYNVVFGTTDATVSGAVEDTRIGAQTADGYDSLEFRNVTSPDNEFKIGAFAALSTTAGPVDLAVPISVVDGDGDTVASGNLSIHISGSDEAPLLAQSNFAAPADDTSSFSLLASDSQEQQVQKTAANSNTTMMAAAVAAAGFAGTEAAASPPADDLLSDSSEPQVFSSQVVEQLSADDGGDAGSSGDALPEAQGADEGPGNSGGNGNGNANGHDNQLDAGSNQASDQGSAHQAANDDGPAVDAAAAGPVAPSVAMVSAEAMQAAGLDGNAQQGGSVEKVLAEALGHGGPPTVDGLLQAITGHGGGAINAIAHVASPAADAVPAWDMGSHGAFVPGADMMFKMGAEMLHHDAVQPVVNG